tara:strand:+ start:4740 stop:5051 length:312 start_codon:yes stop_codon:yes gene_type:complete
MNSTYHFKGFDKSIFVINACKRKTDNLDLDSKEWMFEFHKGENLVKLKTKIGRKYETFQATSPDLYEAVDKVVKKVKKTILKSKAKRLKNKRHPHKKSILAVA